jgi:NDP-hexose 3,5-(Or5-) epimerase
MDISATRVLDALQITPNRLHDHRGTFFEAWRQETLAAAIGRPFVVRQVNYAISRRNTLRGFHYAITPPGQAKLVTCVQGAVLTAVLDLRLGSPTFGVCDVIAQDEESGVGVYAAEGLGLAFLARTDGAWMNYLCSTGFVAETMIGVQALDPAVGVPWNLSEPPLMSEKDARAPTVAQAATAGLLPTYESCLAFYDAEKNAEDRGYRS